MSEHSAHSGDYVQPPHGSEFIDVRETEIWQDFLVAMYDVEERMAPYSNPDGQQAKRLSEQYAKHLNQIFGLEYTNQQSRVMALAYSEMSPEEMIVLNAQCATYCGCKVMFIDDRWQTAFAFCADGTEDGVPSDTYYVPVDPQYLAELAIQLDVDNDEEPDDRGSLTIVQILQEEAESTQAHIRSEDFTSMPPHGQRMVLYDMCDDIAYRISHEEQEQECVVDCAKYHAVYDNMPEIDMRAFAVDREANGAMDFMQPRGRIDGVAYAELIGVPESHVFSAADFDIGEGAPCLIVRNDVYGCNYYVPLIAVNDVINIL